MQLVHEAALCVTGIREQRALSQRGFELAGGLPFVASDTAAHQLLDSHAICQSQELQVALGRIRQVNGNFKGRLLAIDPHRTRSFSKRQMRRFRSDSTSKPQKVSQTFFALDADTHQPVCFTIATAAKTANSAGIELLDMSSKILQTKPNETLVLADSEHFSFELFEHVVDRTPFDLLVPMVMLPPLRKQLKAIPPEQFTRHWAGFATTKLPYKFARGHAGPLWQIAQRFGEDPSDYHFGAFISTTDHDEVGALTGDFPKRWHIEEFFNAHQALGWNRAGTMNLNIRYGQMTMSLLAQALIGGVRKRLGEPACAWDSAHLAKSVFSGLEGDIRVRNDTIVVTYYNAPNVEQLRQHYEGLPDKLEQEGIDPHIPWLFNFQLDFRFK